MANPVSRPRGGTTIQSAKVVSRRSEVRDRLLQAGAELFVARGIGNVSVEDLLEAAGISRATFYGFFANKSELAAAIMQPVFASVIEALSAKPPRQPRAAAERLVEMYIELWERHREALLLTSMVDSTVFPYIREAHDRFGMAIRQYLQSIAVAGRLRNGDVDLSYLLLAKTGIPLLRLYQSHAEFETVFSESMLALLLKE